MPVQPTLRSVTSIDAVQLAPSALDSWWATWVQDRKRLVAAVANGRDQNRAARRGQASYAWLASQSSMRIFPIESTR